MGVGNKTAPLSQLLELDQKRYSDVLSPPSLHIQKDGLS